MNNLPILAELDSNQNEIAQLLPKHIEIERFMQICRTAILHNYGLKECEPKSLLAAFINCAKDGLMPDNREATILPYNSKVGNEWVNKAQYQVMVDGLLKKIRQSGEIATVAARAVFENDVFDYYFDETGEHIKYAPNLTGDRGDFKLAFAYAKYKSTDEFIVEVMPKQEIDRVKESSKSSDKAGSPWKKWYDRMAVKSVLHRLGRRLPNSTEMLEMIERDTDLPKFDNRPVAIEAPKKAHEQPYSDDDFKKNFPIWSKAIIAGKKTHKEIISIVSTKGELSEDQQMQINDIGVTQ